MLRLAAMVKLILIFLALVMLLQVIKPIGLPGLRRRADAWKLAAGAVALVSLLSVVKLQRSSQNNANDGR